MTSVRGTILYQVQLSFNNVDPLTKQSSCAFGSTPWHSDADLTKLNTKWASANCAGLLSMHENGIARNTFG